MLKIKLAEALGIFGLIIITFSSAFAKGTIHGDTLVCLNNKVYTYHITDVNGVVSKIDNNNKLNKKISSSTDSITIKWLVPGIDSIVVYYISESGNDRKMYFPVIVLDKPEANFSFDFYEEATDFTNLTNEFYVEYANQWIENKYYWNFGRENDSLTIVNWDTIIRYDEGIYNVTMIAETPGGCSDTVTKEVVYGDFAGLYMPNAIYPLSPSEGVRNIKAIGQRLSEFEIWIFDTWGNLVWYSNKLNNGVPSESWDGRCNGTVLNTGTYIWKIKAKLENKTEWKGLEHKGEYITIGNIMLIR